MKKINARVLLLAGLLSVGLLTACSKKDPAPAETTGADTTVEEVTKGETDAAPVETDPVEETEAPADETTAEAVTEPATEPETTAEPETYPEIILPADPAGVMELIDSIPEGTLDSEWDIDRAYAAWAALSEADRAKVTNYDKLRQLLQEVADAHIIKTYQDTRIPHGELLLGGYCLFPYPTDEDMQNIVDAHLDFICGVSNDPTTLGQFAKFGVGAFVPGSSFGVPNYHVGSSWKEEGWQNLDTARSIKAMELMLQAASQMSAKDHEAIWGIDYRDEPGAGDFWFYDYVLDATNKEYSQVQTFTNLLPNYGSPSQLGMYGYRRYILEYAHRVSGDILSMDHYIYDTAMIEGQASLFRGLEDMADAAENTGKDIMMILQLNRNREDRITTLGEVKFQAYCAMAYGTKYIVWGCYDYGWWDNQALDRNKQPTEQYYKMQETNADLKTLSPIFMRYTAKGQTMLNPTALRDFVAARAPMDTLGIKTIADLTASEETKSLLVGFFEKNVGQGEAFMLVNTNTFDQNGTNTETSTVTFRTVSPSSVVTAYVKGVPTILTPVNGVYTISVVDADAVFVTVTEPDSLNVEPVAPVGQLTIGGTDVAEFSIVIPADATEREETAAKALVAIIKEATFKTLPVVTDAKAPAHGIYLGKITPSMEAACAALKADGYVIKTEGGNLYISGNDAAGAGTLFGVYSFCEEYLNVGFYADDYVTIPAAEAIAVADGITATHNPSFTFRDTTNYVAMDQEFPLFQKYNGYSVFGDVNVGATQFGGYALYRLCNVAEKYDEHTVCLSDESVYATALANAKSILSADPDAEYLACDMGLGGEWNVCSCDTCAAAVAQHGVMGYTLQFANRLAADIKAENPNVKVLVTAAGERMAAPATVRPAENVAVRVALPATACRFHALGDEDCEANAAICKALEDWTKICDHVILLDQVTERTDKELQRFSGNLLALYDTVQYLKGLGVVGYQQMGYDTYSGEFEAMNAYLLSRLLWDADMTREEYLAEMDGFLAAYYGAAASYIRQYVDKFYANDGMKHSDYKTANAMIFRTGDKAFGKACFDLWYAAMEVENDPVARRNAEYSSIQALSIAQAIRDNENGSYFRKLMNKYGFETS